MHDLKSWLSERGLDRLYEVFEANEVDAEVLPELTDADLRELGIALGPRKKLLKAIAILGQDDPAPAETPAETPERAPQTQDAERRHLTVMFVDLVGSTELAGLLDPEEMREVIVGYQNAVAGAVTRFAGQVAKYMGDGVLCYFGWPRAHEDDAERAVRAGLSVMPALALLSTPHGKALAARVGISSGLVVVGDLIGTGSAQEEAVVGETPNLAARLQALAEAGQVVVADSTRRLLGDVFEFRDFGRRTLKGIAGTTAVFAVAGERSAESRFEARAGGRTTAMVGRDHELGLMRERWKQAKAGEGQLLILSGEAGIGKSRITKAMIDAVEAEPHIRLSFQCSPYHTDSSLYPVIQQLKFAAGIAADDDGETKLDKLEATLQVDRAQLFAALLGLEAEGRYGPIRLNPQQQRSQTLDALVAQLIALSRQKPLLFVLEDAHWIDATTLELLDLCLDPVAGARVLMLVTARPTFEQGFGGHPIVTGLTLNRLARDQIAAVVDKLTGGKPLPSALMEEIFSKTDGVPLFVEELTKTILELPELRETESAYELTGPLSSLAIPATLHDSLMARLDRLQPVKEVAQTAACIGREFDYRLLSDILPMEAAALGEALDQLLKAELVFGRGLPPDASYTFKHALVRDAAYESLLKTRRRAIHEKLVTALEARAGAAPEVLAHHALQAGLKAEAIGYLRKAGDAAAAQPAYQEAITHITRAVSVIEEMPERGPWHEAELELQLQLAQLYMTKIGYASLEAAQAFESAMALLKVTGNLPLRLPVIYGSWIGHYIRSEHDKAIPIVARLVEEADRGDDDVSRMVAHRMMAATDLVMGRPRAAQEHLEVSLAHYRPYKVEEYASRFPQEPGVQVKVYLVLSLWTLGYADQAERYAAEAEKAAREMGHINTLCYAALHWSMLALCKRDDVLLRQSSQLMVDYSIEYGLQLWKNYGEFGLGFLDCRAGSEAGFDALKATFDGYEAKGCRIFVPLYRAEVARDRLRAGQTPRAREAIAAALAFTEAWNERWVEAEIHRLVGEIELAEGAPNKAEAAYLRAIEVARRQHAKAWEIRAATSLAELWADQGRQAEARDLLAPLIAWFTEGLQSPDLKAARTLLNRL